MILHDLLHAQVDIIAIGGACVGLANLGAKTTTRRPDRDQRARKNTPQGREELALHRSETSLGRSPFIDTQTLTQRDLWHHRLCGFSYTG